MKTRIMQARIMFTKGILEGENELVKEVLGEVRKLDRFGWNLSLNRYLGEIGLEFGDIGRLGREEIKKRIKDYDTECWWGELGGLRSVDIYKEYKLGLGEDRPYNNGIGSVLLFKARSNTLLLGDRNRFEGKDVRCEVCRQELEDLGHFILRCPGLIGARRRELIEDVGGSGERDRLGRLLFTGGRVLEVRDMLRDLWKMRFCRIARNRRDRGEDPLTGFPV